MSLKIFHILFISVSAVFFFGFGLWLLVFDSLEPFALDIVAALSSFAVGGLLLLYGKRFLKKFKSVSNL